MSYATQKTNRRSTRSSLRKTKTRSKKKRVNKIEVAQALVVEGLAVILILAVFFGMRSDSGNQSQGPVDSQQVNTYEQDFGYQAKPNGQFAQKGIAQNGFVKTSSVQKVFQSMRVNFDQGNMSRSNKDRRWEFVVAN